MPENNKLLKYTEEDIARIFNERVKVVYHESTLKKGIIAEFSIEFPNGNISVDVEKAFAMSEENHDAEIGREVVRKNIKEKLWRICGQFTLATGVKL